MNIEIDISAANDVGSHRYLDRVARKVEEQWHRLALPPTDDVRALQKSSWATRSDPYGKAAQALLHAAIRQSAWQTASTPNNGPTLHERRIRITLNPTLSNELEPCIASDFVETQLVILVENRFSDGNFIKRAILELDRTLHSWTKRCAPVYYDSTGGSGQMIEVIQALPTAPPRPRYVVVVDSDRKALNAHESKVAKGLRKKCCDLGIPCWVLAKRESENYLPYDLIMAKPNISTEYRTSANDWNTFTEAKKDVEDMKKRFGDKVADCWNLYPSDDIRSALRARGAGELARGLSLIRQEV